MEHGGAKKKKELRPSDGSKTSNTKKFETVGSRYLEKAQKTSTPTKTTAAASSALGSDLSTAHFPERSRRYSVNDVKSKTIKEKGGEVMSEEAKDDLLFEAYDIYLLAAMSDKLVKQTEKCLVTHIDKQLGAMQQCVNKYMEDIAEANKIADAVCLLNSAMDMINIQTVIISGVEDEPAFMKGKSLTELTNEVEILRNQLPCNGIAVPKTRPEIASFKNAASQLAMSIDGFSAASGQDEVSTSKGLEELQNITRLQYELESLEPSIAVAKPRVSASVLEEAASKSLKITPSVTEGNSLSSD